MNVRLLVCFALLAICASPIIGDSLPSVWNIIRAALGIYLRQKYVTFFKFLDFTQDGKLEQADLDYAADKIAELYPGVDPARIQEFHNVTIPKAWAAFRRMFPETEPGPISVVDMLLLFANSPQVLLNIKTFTDAMAVLDLNADGIINQTEYTAVFRARDRSTSEAIVSFRESDSDRNGNVTQEELIVCATAFFETPLEILDTCKDLVGPRVSPEEADGGIA